MALQVGVPGRPPNLLDPGRIRRVGDFGRSLALLTQYADWLSVRISPDGGLCLSSPSPTGCGRRHSLKRGPAIRRYAQHGATCDSPIARPTLAGLIHAAGRWVAGFAPESVLKNTAEPDEPS